LWRKAAGDWWRIVSCAAARDRMRRNWRSSFINRGVGRQLLLGTLNYGCKQLHLSRVWLTTLGSNPVAAHLFSSVGFRLRHGDEPAWELDMERPSGCARCKGKRCAVFNTALPLTVSLA